MGNKVQRNTDTKKQKAWQVKDVTWECCAETDEDFQSMVYEWTMKLQLDGL